jgi:DNA-binding MarR family transcriptional regulator
MIVGHHSLPPDVNGSWHMTPTEGPTSALGELVQNLYDMQVQHARLVQHLAMSHHLNPVDVRTLKLLGGTGGPRTPKDIGEYLEMGTGAVTAMLDRLETRELTRREPNPRDRRSVVLRLEPGGQAVVDELREAYLEALGETVDLHDRILLTSVTAGLAAQFKRLAELDYPR